MAANKMFYIKNLGSQELCMVYGYIKDGYYHLFYRSKANPSITQAIGDYPSKEAWELFNNTDRYYEENK